MEPGLDISKNINIVFQNKQITGGPVGRLTTFCSIIRFMIERTIEHACTIHAQDNDALDSMHRL